MADKNLIVRIPSEQMRSEFLRILLSLGFSDPNAEKCAEIFMINSLEGIYSHGVNRFYRFVTNVKDGLIFPNAVPTRVHTTGSLEQWNGNLGAGPLNAIFATNRSMELASINGIGLVTLANTNHWMRAGSYGWQAAKNGYVLLCWTNTCPNMPAWGATDPRLGNNPFVLALPYGNDAIVLDFAMTQFSYGKMESYRNEGSDLPYPGGFNLKGELTTNPNEILESWRPVPVGFWKGASLSLVLDILATILSGGRAVHQIEDCNSEYGISQVFIAINISNLKNFPAINNSIDEIIKDLHNSKTENINTRTRYPGENVAKIRDANLKDGIPVAGKIWKKIQTL